MHWNNPRLSALALGLLFAATLWLGSARGSVGAVWSRQEPAQSPAAEARPRPDFLVIVDAGHGGDDPGATLDGKLLEKDLTLALARQLRDELEERGVSVRMVRESDMNVGLNRRAEIANDLRPNLYIALHAGQPGQGARVYAPALTPSTGKTEPFLPWESAQAASITQSKNAARIVAVEMSKTGMSVREMTTPLRPLNNITAPAIAIEWATGSQRLKPQQMQKLEAALASAIAAGIVQTRHQIGARP